MSLADLSIDKVHCCYFDEGNLHVIDRCGRRPQNYNRSIETLIGTVYIYESRGKVYSTLLT